MEERRDWRADIATIDKEIKELEEQLAQLYEKRQSIELVSKAAETDKATKLLLNQVCRVSCDNTLKVQLEKGTKTTPIMDSFQKSDKEFLLFENIFTLSENRKKVSLVITKGVHGVRYVNDGLTMTDLKKAAKTLVGAYSANYMSKSNRKYNLYQELIEVDKNKLVNGQGYAFRVPCLLGGQTFNDQTGFGSEYCGERLTYRGKNYGETTMFLIIGVIVN